MVLNWSAMKHYLHDSVQMLVFRSQFGFGSIYDWCIYEKKTKNSEKNLKKNPSVVLYEAQNHGVKQ